jgi:undecaprenyl-diphosphatase
MVAWFDAILLGFVQGITEWLPISSSGHLVIVQQLLGIEAPFIFDVLLHFGSLLAIVAFFRKELWGMLQTVLRNDFRAGGRIIVFALVGTIPVGVVGILAHDMIAGAFGNIHDVGVLMVLMGFILFNTRFVKGERKMSLLDAFWIGVAQATALAPGISRSGTTISMALMRQVRKEQAFVFSFMLSIPAILGANAYELYKGGFDLTALTPEMGLGVVIAAIVGYATLDMLRKFVLEGRLYKFAYYCWAVGFLILAYTFFVI